jgi:hypothetical protein
MKKFLKVMLITVATVAVLLLGTYLYLRYMPEKSVSKQETDFKVMATVLADEYSLNPEASDRKYIDRVVEVTGIIAEITTDQNNSTVFILRENSTTTGILCTLDNSAAKKARQYKTGSKITLKGTCTGMLFEVVLNKCVIIR